jgi:hypothetical protein
MSETKRPKARIAEFESVLSGRTVSCSGCNEAAKRLAAMTAWADRMAMRAQQFHDDEWCSCDVSNPCDLAKEIDSRPTEAKR